MNHEHKRYFANIFHISPYLHQHVILPKDLENLSFDICYATYKFLQISFSTTYSKTNSIVLQSSYMVATSNFTSHLCRKYLNRNHQHNNRVRAQNCLIYFIVSNLDRFPSVYTGFVLKSFKTDCFLRCAPFYRQAEVMWANGAYACQLPQLREISVCRSPME